MNGFKSMKATQLGDKLFENALQTFKRRMERMTQVAHPVIKQVYEHQGAMYETDCSEYCRMDRGRRRIFRGGRKIIDGGD